MFDSTRSFIAKAAAPHGLAPSLCHMRIRQNKLRVSANIIADVTGLFKRKSVALPGPWSIHRIKIAERACPPIVPLRRARPNYSR